MLSGKHTRPRSQKHLPTTAKEGCHSSPHAAVSSQSQEQLLPWREGILSRACSLFLWKNIYWCLKTHTEVWVTAISFPTPSTVFITRQGAVLTATIVWWRMQGSVLEKSFIKEKHKQLPGRGRLSVYCLSRVSSWGATWTLRCLVV